MGLRIAVVLGSTRSHSNTAKAMAIVTSELAALKGVTLDVLDPRQMPLPLPGVDDAGATAQCSALQARIKACHGVVMLTPEYDGSFSAVIKLMIEYLGYPSVLAGKPVALVGVAGGRIGAMRALEHLRTVCVHIGAIVVPVMPNLAAVHASFDAAGACTDPAVDAGLRAVAREIVQYARALA